MDFQSFLWQFGTWWSSDAHANAFTVIDLLAATTNAFNGALLARRPDHLRQWTIVGIVALAVLGGIGGGVTRDVLLNDVPAAFTNPLYLILCAIAATVAIGLDNQMEVRLRDGLFLFMGAFSLPWYAAVGADKALEAHLPYIAAIVIGVIGPTAGRYFIDITAGVTPQHFVRGEWFVGTAVLASVVYITCYQLGVSIWPATLVSFVVGFVFRLAALHFRWEEPEPWEPKQVPADQGSPARLAEASQIDVENS